MSEQSRRTGNAGLTTELTTSKEIRPANVYDLAANETWLEDQAAQGWHLTGMTGWGAAFEKGEPRSVRYRMQPVPGKEKQGPPEEVRALYAELGWAYVCNLSGIFRVWRCDNPAVPELDTDPVVQELGYGYLKRRMFWDLLTSLLLLAVLVLLAGAVLLRGATPVLRMVTEWVPGRLLVGEIACALIVVLTVCQIRSILRLLRTLRAGIPLRRPKPYRLQRWLARGLLTCFVFLVAAHFLGNFRNMSGSGLGRGWDAGDSYDRPDSGVVYVDLAALEGAEVTEFWRCKTKVQELCPRMYETWQLALEPDGEALQPGDSLPVTGSAITTYYRLLTEGLARQAEQELAQRRIASLRVSGHPALTELSPAPEGLDSFWWAEDTYYQYILARAGREVVFLEYEGETDLREKGAYFASLLAQPGS